MAARWGNPMPTFVVHVRRTREVLARVVLLFHRRAIEIERLTAERAEEPNVMRLTITIEIDNDESRRIRADLYKIVDVLLVETSNEIRRSEPHARMGCNPR
jgi:acetolactate synthase-1/3 small subunit